MLTQKSVALVPCANVGIGTNTATIRNVRTKERVTLKGIDTVTLVGRVACIRLPVLSRDGADVMVLLPDDRVAWVRPVAEEPALQPVNA